MAKAIVGTPDTEELAVALGPALELWNQLLSELEKRFGPLTHEWKKYTSSSPWALRLLQKKRNLIFLSPGQPIAVTLLLGDKAVERACADARVPEWLVEEIRKSKRYPEGTGVRLQVREAADILPPVLLISAKLAA